MKVRTLEELTDKVDADLAWRRKELIALEGLVSDRRGTQFEGPLLRSSLAVLYAHWEGFLTAAGGVYLAFVAQRRLDYGELATNFVALCIRARLMQNREATEFMASKEVADLLLLNPNSKSSVPWRDGIRTKANLGSEVLKDIVACLGLDYSPYLTKEKLIDEKLVRQRNEIAHGRHLLIDVAEYLNLHGEVVQLLDVFRTQVENAAATASYRRAPVGAPAALSLSGGTGTPGGVS